MIGFRHQEGQILSPGAPKRLLSHARGSDLCLSLSPQVGAGGCWAESCWDEGPPQPESSSLHGVRPGNVVRNSFYVMAPDAHVRITHTPHKAACSPLPWVLHFPSHFMQVSRWHLRVASGALGESTRPASPEGVCLVSSRNGLGCWPGPARAHSQCSARMPFERITCCPWCFSERPALCSGMSTCRPHGHLEGLRAGIAHLVSEGRELILLPRKWQRKDMLRAALLQKFCSGS